MSVAARAKGSERAHAALLAPPAPAWCGPLIADPALATRSEPFSAPGWLFELKYDGFRVLAAKDRGEVTLRYRTGRDATDLFPEVARAVAALPAETALLDGELVVFDRQGRPDFGLLHARGFRSRGCGRPPVRACIFDVLALDGRDLRRLPLLRRKQVLEELVVDQDEIVYVEHVEERGEELLRGTRELGLEGVVGKRADAPYPTGRTTSWRKFKNEHTSDFVVVGIAEPSEATFGRNSLLLALVGVARGLRYVGRVAVGVSELTLLEPLLPELRRATPPCAGIRRAGVWLEPAVVCEVRHLAASCTGLRHATFVRFRPDKRWTECVDG